MHTAFTVVAAFTACTAVSSGSDIHVDVLVYGATAPGVMAAIGAANASTSKLKIALLVVGDTPIGGMTTGGLSDVDAGDRSICGGFAREFFFRVGQHYTGTRQFMPKGQECKVSAAYFNEMLVEVSDQVTVYNGVSGLAVTVVDNKVSTLSVAVGGNRRRGSVNESTLMMTRFIPTVVIDASYEGDLIRLSGVSYALGRESKAEYNEPHAGVQPWPFPGSDSGQIFPPAQNYTVNPFLDAANTTLLPLVNGVGLGGEAGSADNKIMSYNFRVCLTNNASNMVPLPKPNGYNPADFELLARYLAVDPKLHALYIAKCPGGHRQPGCGMFIWGTSSYGLKRNL